MRFTSEFTQFLNEIKIDYYFSNNYFICKNGQIIIKLIYLKEVESESESIIERKEGEKVMTILIYEDLWSTKNKIIRNRIKAILMPAKSIFARNCTVKKISAEISSAFLNKNHLLGNTYSKFKYGLYHKESLVAVATFSKPRPMVREGVKVNSYEWVRYASLGEVRIAGGMGKLLSYFENEINPDEIMTYADKEWSSGNVYIKLGFKIIDETEPISFFVNKNTFERCSFAKGAIKKSVFSIENGWIKLQNHGNLKFLRSRI